MENVTKNIKKTERSLEEAEKIYSEAKKGVKGNAGGDGQSKKQSKKLRRKVKMAKRESDVLKEKLRGLRGVEEDELRKRRNG